jgi:signal peptidase II
VTDGAGSGLPDRRPGRAIDAVVLGVTVRRWLVFFGIAALVVIVDQVTKAYVVANYPLGEPVEIVGDWLRIWYIHNTGALFGLFRGQAGLFALVSVGVLVLIVWFHSRTAPTGGMLVTIALGLLLGGALGNFIDRVRLDYVVDFVDMGIGTLRFYTYNVADSAITISILLLLLSAFLPARAPRTAHDGGPAAS